MTQIVPKFQPANRVREQGNDKVQSGQDGAEGTNAGVFTHKPTAAIYGGQDQNQGGQGENPNREAVQFLRDAKTGQLRAVARGVVGTERMRMYPEGSPLRLLGPNARAATFERESRVDVSRKDFMATPFSQGAKFSSLSGARITFGEGDMPFNSAAPFDARKTTLPPEEYGQMQAGMVEARFNKGPVAWGMRHGPIRV